MEDYGLGRRLPSTVYRPPSSIRSSLEGGRASRASQEGGGHQRVCESPARNPPESSLRSSSVPLERETDLAAAVPVGSLGFGLRESLPTSMSPS
jgi:hypothetical protein